MKLDIWNLISNADPIALILATIMIIIGVYKGVIKIKWLKLPRLNKDDPHFNCQHNKSFNETISRAIESASDKAFEIARIKFIETIYYQMVEAHLTWITVGDILKDNFYKQIEQTTVKNEDKQKAIIHYNMMIDKMEKNIMDILRGWMKKNHFIEKSEVEFQCYIEDKVKILIPKISSIIDHGFNRSILCIDMHDLHESALECMPQISAAATTFFHKARSISIDKKKLIDAIKAKE